MTKLVLGKNATSIEYCGIIIVMWRGNGGRLVLWGGAHTFMTSGGVLWLIVCSPSLPPLLLFGILTLFHCYCYCDPIIHYSQGRFIVNDPIVIIDYIDWYWSRGGSLTDRPMTRSEEPKAVYVGLIVLWPYYWRKMTGRINVIIVEILSDYWYVIVIYYWLAIIDPTIVISMASQLLCIISHYYDLHGGRCDIMMITEEEA